MKLQSERLNVGRETEENKTLIELERHFSVFFLNFRRFVPVVEFIVLIIKYKIKIVLVTYITYISNILIINGPVNKFTANSVNCKGQGKRK
jgi:hypothetical protein